MQMIRALPDTHQRPSELFAHAGDILRMVISRIRGKKSMVKRFPLAWHSVKRGGRGYKKKERIGDRITGEEGEGLCISIFQPRTLYHDLYQPPVGIPPGPKLLPSATLLCLGP